MNASTDWRENISKLEAHYQKHGDFNISSHRYPDKVFSRWVENIRKHPHRLPTELQKELVRIGFDFGATSDWDTNFLKLEEFCHLYGHTYVPRHQKKYESLFDWTLNQKRARPLLVSDQIKKLDSLRFDWTVLNDDDLRWEEKYRQLAAFKEQYGHAKVTYSNKENPELGIWVSAQRQKQTKNKLSPERTDKLNELGFLWKEDIANIIHGNWETRYSELVAYQEKHGHMDRLQIKKDHYQLGLWVETQIVVQDKMLADRKQKLNKINFNWDKEDIYEIRWNEMYERLLLFKEKHGHSRVTNSKDYKLSIWVKSNAQDHETLRPDRKEKLEQAGVKWPNQLFEEIWESMFQKLKTFQEKHGHLSVPRSDPKLFEWIQTQKSFKLENTLNKEREEKLDGIAFLWAGDVELERLKKWKTMLGKFVIFQEKYGDSYHIELKKHPKLEHWVNRQVHNKDKMSSVKKEMLNAVDFVWNRSNLYKDELWEEKYKELVLFKNKFGHCDISPSYTEYKSLATWVKSQRTKELKPYRRNKLNEIGFSWANEIKQQQWFQRIKEYADLKAKDKLLTLRAHMPLHSWLYQQRKNFHKMPQEKKELLIEIGIVSC